MILSDQVDKGPNNNLSEGVVGSHQSSSSGNVIDAGSGSIFKGDVISLPYLQEFTWYR